MSAYYKYGNVGICLDWKIKFFFSESILLFFSNLIFIVLNPRTVEISMVWICLCFKFVS